MKRFILAALAAFAIVALPASAGKPQPVSPLSLAVEYIYNNPSSPPWCLNEDDWHQREWGGGSSYYGSFAGTMVVSEYYCIPLVDVYNGYDQWGGGGVGLAAEIIAVGNLDQLTLSNSDFIQPAELVSTEITGRGANRKTWNRYQACVFIGSQNYSDGPLTGTWTITLVGDFSQARYSVTARMLSSTWEASHCPPDQR